MIQENLALTFNDLSDTSKTILIFAVMIFSLWFIWIMKQREIFNQTQNNDFVKTKTKPIISSKHIANIR